MIRSGSLVIIFKYHSQIWKAMFGAKLAGLVSSLMIISGLRMTNNKLFAVHTVFLAFFAAVPSIRAQPARTNVIDKPAGLENRYLSFYLTARDAFTLTNNLTGKSYKFNGDSFEFLIEAEGRKESVSSADFDFEAASRPDAETMIIRYAGTRDWKGLRVEANYTLARESWYIQKQLRITNAAGKPIILHDAAIEKSRLEGIRLPEKPVNPLFLDGQLFWGLEWPIAVPAFDRGNIIFRHHPGITLLPGDSWTGKISGLGVSEAGKAREAFGRYLLEIRINRVDFATFYFDWLCHDNSGPLESEILANFAALKKLKELYGLQFDIYNSDAGLVESQGTYFPQYRAIFDKRFPRGLRPVADAAAALRMRLGLWVGPDGFGETPDAMAARRSQLVSWVRDFNVGLFKFDTVVSALRHDDKYVLEKKYQSLVDALAEARRIDPSFIAINHRVNNSPYMLTVTDCLLWRGQETYIDVHITNTSDSLYNRDCSINRELTSQFFDVPFRQFEDHGICFNSCIEKWDNDLVAQAFGRASVLSPEMYGTFFFLRDDDYPRLARLIQLHKQSEPLLKRAFPLKDGDISHSDGRAALIVVRNPSWESKTKSIPLDGTIGLAAATGAPMTVRQRHPHELLLEAERAGFKFGDSLQIELDPFDLRLIQVDLDPVAEPYLGGIPYDVAPHEHKQTFDLKLLGAPGQEYDVKFHNFEGRTLASDEKKSVPPAGKALKIGFPGKKLAEPFFSDLGDCRDVAPGEADGTYLAELAKFSIDDDSLEIRELEELKRNPSALPEIEACRAYMWRNVVETEGTCRNAFDGQPATRWSDGFPKRNSYSSIPVPYRSDSSLWRIDMGESVDLAKLELSVVRRTDAAFLESAEVSTDLKNWTRGGGLSFRETVGIPFSKEIRQRRQPIKLYDVEAGDGKPVTVVVSFPPNRSRFVRMRGRNFGVSEIVGYDRRGGKLDRSQWRATNFYGETAASPRILKSVHTLRQFWPGREFAVAVRGGKQKLDPVDGAFVVFAVDGKMIVPQKRAPSYPYHSYEANSSYLKDDKLEGMTFRLPVRPEWKGKKVEVCVVLSGEGAEDATARVRLVTPVAPDVPKIIHVTPAG